MLGRMKKLALLVSLAFATPVFACPHMDGEAAKTADKDKKEEPKKDTTTAKDTKPADTAKAKPAPAPTKTGDKVSQK